MKENQLEHIEPLARLYRHYKGNIYQWIDSAKHSETLEDLVVYKSLYTGEFPYGQIWVRPYHMFFEMIEVERKLIPRFALLTSEQVKEFLKQRGQKQ